MTPTARATATSPRRRAARSTTAALATAGALAGALVLAAPASAHDRLVGSDPESGAVLTAVPAEATLTFSSEVQEIGTVVELHDDAGQVVGDAPTQVEGRDVVLALPADLGAGAYDVVYRVTSSDGHPISGEVPFTLDVAAPAPSASTPAPTATPTSGATAAPSATTAPDAAVDDAEPASSSDAQDGAPWTAVAVVAVLAVLAAVAGTLAVRRRRPRTR